MIINALSDFYKILSNDEESEISPRFFSKVDAKYQVVINEDGDVVDINSLMNEKGKGMICSVPEQSGRTTAGVPYFVCDNSQYIFGCSKVKNEFVTGKNEIKSFESIKKLHNEVLKDATGDCAKAILNFFNNWDIYKTLEHPVIKKFENEKNSVLDKVNIIFRLINHGESLHNDAEVRRLWVEYCKTKQSNGDGSFGVCSINGVKDKIARVHPSIKGMGAVGGKSLCAITTFNCDSFESYNKSQGFNAPIGEETAFEYTTMLNELISNKSYNIRMGDDTLTLFWASTKETKYNAFAGFLLSGDEERADNNTINEIKQFLDNSKSGIFINYNPDTPFYILSISPNSSRISIRYFYKSTFGTICENLRKHYNDINVIKSNFDKYEVLPLWRILNGTKRDKKPGVDSKEKINPMLQGPMLEAIIGGNPYPALIYNLVLGRIKAGDEINRERVSIIKGFINRLPNKKEEITMSLNESSENTAYLLGRLFGVLERIQSRSLNFKKDAKTIKDSYFTSACTTPGLVFPRLLKLSQFHMAKLESGQNFCEKEVEDIFLKIKGEKFPKHLSLEDQGTFIMGYYHQNAYVNEQIAKIKESKKDV